MDLNNKKNQNYYLVNKAVNLNDIGFFNGNEYLIFVYKKIEKVTAALYAISNLFPNEEPLKWVLRDKGLCLLSCTLNLVSLNVSERETVVNKIFSLVLEVISLFEIAYLGNLISEMNHSILVRELNSLISFINNKEESEKTKSGYILSDTFFEVDTITTKEPQDTIPKRQDTVKLKDTKREGGNQPGMPIAAQNPKKDLTERKDSRKSIIIELLKKADNLTIKDFTRVIVNCSEKTIQRELLSLVSEGVLKKRGERRWSTYSLS